MAAPLERTVSYSRLTVQPTTYDQPPSTNTEVSSEESTSSTIYSRPTPPSEWKPEPLPESVFNDQISIVDLNQKIVKIGLLIGSFYEHPNALELCKSFNKRIANEKQIKPLSQEVVEAHLTARRKSTTDAPRPPRNDLDREIAKLFDNLLPFPLDFIQSLCTDFDNEINGAINTASIRQRSFSAAVPVSRDMSSPPPRLSAPPSRLPPPPPRPRASLALHLQLARDLQLARTIDNPQSSDDKKTNQ